MYIYLQNTRIVYRTQSYLTVLSGYPDLCIDAANGNLKSVCFSLDLSQNQFDGRIRELCPKLEQKPFKLFNFEKSRKLAEFPSTKLKEIKEMRYKGITVVQEGGEHVSPETIVREEEITESVPAISKE